MAAGAIHHRQPFLAQRMREHPKAATPTSAAVPAMTPMATRWSTVGLNPPCKIIINNYFSLSLGKGRVCAAIKLIIILTHHILFLNKILQIST